MIRYVAVSPAGLPLGRFASLDAVSIYLRSVEGEPVAVYAQEAPIIRIGTPYRPLTAYEQQYLDDHV